MLTYIVLIVMENKQSIYWVVNFQTGRRIERCDTFQHARDKALDLNQITDEITRARKAAQAEKPVLA